MHELNSAPCWETLTWQHGLLQITLDFWHTRRPFFSLKEPVLDLAFILRDGIWSANVIYSTISIPEHQWEPLYANKTTVTWIIKVRRKYIKTNNFQAKQFVNSNICIAQKKREIGNQSPWPFFLRLNYQRILS